MEKRSFSGMAPSLRVFVGNLGYAVSVSEFKTALASIAIVPDEVHVVTDRETGKGRGFGFLSFRTQAEASNAVAVLNGCRMGERVLRADFASERKGRAARPPVPTEAKRYSFSEEDRFSGGSRR